MGGQSLNYIYICQGLLDYITVLLRGENMLEVKNLTVGIKADKIKNVLYNVSLSVAPGEVHAIMGPNGSGKTSLLYSIMGHPRYVILNGKIFLDGEDITFLPPEEKSLRGLFISFQHPVEVEGVRLSTLLIAAKNKRAGESDLLKISDVRMIRDMRQLAARIGLKAEFLRRDVNVGFSGGERKRSELFQALYLKPKYMLLDEPDTGLDVDGVKVIAESISSAVSEGVGVLLVTHYARILNYVRPDRVSVIVNGRIVETGGPELAQLIDREGYSKYGVVEVDGSG